MTQGSSPTQFGVLAPHYDELMDIVPYETWAEYVQLLFRVADANGDAEPRTLLDCCCGTGNVSFELAHLGYKVTGVDIAPAMIKVARTKNEVSGSKLRFFEADLSDFNLGEQFEAATCLYDSLNYILDPQKLQSAFERVAAHVVPGGVFVFDMNSELALTSDLFTQSSRNPRKTLHYNWKAHYDPQSKITQVEMEFSRAANGQIELFREVHRERAYSMGEIENMLDVADWDLLKTYDAYTINPPHDNSERWFFVAQRR